MLAAFIPLAACGGATANVPPPANVRSEPPSENSGRVTTPGVKPACTANVSEYPTLVPSPGAQPVTEAIPTRPAEEYVVVRCMLHKEGHVSDCNFVCSYPRLEKTVRENIQERRYSPATLDGVPVDATYTFSFHIVGQF
ncbi:energy transducer TonB [Pendulispora brunnea]|uniref:energy transducer TonB n=1 Tax=Pendulispora brunnea TaxID=2905690 RepID=UPI00374E05F4